MDMNPDFISSAFTQSIKSDTPITIILQSAIRRFSLLVIFDIFFLCKIRGILIVVPYPKVYVFTPNLICLLLGMAYNFQRL